MAEIQTEIINAVSTEAGISNIGELSPAVDCTMQFAGGAKVKRYLDGSGVNTMRILCLAKSANQLTLTDGLNHICNELSKIRRKTGTGWEIRRIEVGTPPAPKGYDGNVWIYACVLSVEYYYDKL